MENRSVSVILPAAGNATRMQGIQKTFFQLSGVSVLCRSIRLFENHPSVGEIIVVVRSSDLKAVREMLQAASLDQKVILTAGGDTRFESVKNGLQVADEQFPFVAIHDAARPLCAAEDIDAVFAKAFEQGAAALGLPIKDTVKQTSQGQILKTIPRAELVGVQTPQVFRKDWYREGLCQAARGGDYTDDCQLLEAIGKPIAIVAGSERNLKLTTPFDLTVAEAVIREEAPTPMQIRIGHGYDVHRLTTDRQLILGGVLIPYEKGLAGHSDADVLVHAIMDSMLGAVGLGDIGRHFPDTDDAYLGADSIALLQQVTALVLAHGWRVGNIDATVLAEAPKLAPYIQTMRERIAAACSVAVDQVNVKATTEEKLGFTGAGEGIAAHAVCLLQDTATK